MATGHRNGSTQDASALRTATLKVTADDDQGDAVEPDNGAQAVDIEFGPLPRWGIFGPLDYWWCSAKGGGQFGQVGNSSP